MLSYDAALRSLGDARRLVTSAKEAKQVILVGAGFISMEVAASLRKGGLEVTIVAPDPVPLKRVLGERVGRTLQAAQGPWAAGDIARFPDPQWGQPVRVEHWRLVQQHGPVAAPAILGLEARYQGMPFFWSEQYDHSLVYVGHAAGWNQEA